MGTLHDELGLYLEITKNPIIAIKKYWEDLLMINPKKILSLFLLMALSILYLGTFNAFAQPSENNYDQSIDLKNLSTDSFDPVVSDFISQL